MSCNSTVNNKVIINEVSPRDGLQNQDKVLSVAERVELIESLLAAGIKSIEVGSFVSPKAVPAMANTDAVFKALPADAADFSVLIPNLRGYELAVAAGVKNISMVIASTETMNQKNVNMSVAQSLDICVALIEQGKAAGNNMIMCVATAWECPFEGKVEPQVIVDIVAKLVAAGASEIVLADTIGAADPSAVKTLMLRLVEEFGADMFSCHFHDTRGFGVANVYAAVEAGIRKFDASAGGLGGCPFAPGASGNVATEDVVLMLNQMGYETSIDLAALVAASDLAEKFTGVATGGNSSRWLKRQIEKNANVNC